MTSYTYGQEKEISVYITGNTHTTEGINTLRTIAKDASDDSKLLLLGNTTPENGFDDTTISIVDDQLNIVSSLKKNVIFTPGHNE